MPRVTVGIPVFNGERYLEETVESLLAQEYRDFVLLISDNGSTDDTERICRRFADRDTRVVYYREQQNRGAAWNYNRLLDLASTPYFKWQAADDAVRPSFLGECVSVLDARPEVVLCYAPAEYIGPDGRHKRFVRNPPGYAHGATPAARIRSTLRVTTHCFEIFGVMRTASLLATRRIGAYPASDVVLLAELALLGEFAQLEEPLFRHRMHRQRSVFQHEDRRDLVQWYTPDARRILAPRWRLLREFSGAFVALPVSRRARASASLALVPWAWRHRRQLGYDLAQMMPTPVAAWARALRDRNRRRLKRSKADAHGTRA